MLEHMSSGAKPQLYYHTPASGEARNPPACFRAVDADIANCSNGGGVGGHFCSEKR